MAHPKRKVSKTRKDKKRIKALSGNVITGASSGRKVSVIHRDGMIIGGLLTGGLMPISIKKTQITVGGVTALIGTTEYIEKISNLPAFQNNEKVRLAKHQGRRKYLPKIKFSGEQYHEAMHLVSGNLNTDSDKK